MKLDIEIKIYMLHRTRMNEMDHSVILAYLWVCLNPNIVSCPGEGPSKGIYLFYAIEFKSYFDVDSFDSWFLELSRKLHGMSFLKSISHAWT